MDVFGALSLYLSQHDRGRLALGARLRCAELLKVGRKSLHPNAPTGKAALDFVAPPIREGNIAEVPQRFARLRREVNT